jgi:hypothetical protein
MGIVTINIPSQLPVLTGNSLLYLRVNVAENGIEWAATAGGGITIGTTAIASGTVNRILFEGAGNVVQQDSTFVWDNTDKRLILGTEAVASTNSRLVVIGKGTGTNQTFAVHDSTGTNNSLVIRDDGFVGIGRANPTNGNGLLSVAGDMIASLNTTSTLSMGVYTQSGNAAERARVILRTGNASTGNFTTLTCQPSNASGGRRAILDVAGIATSNPTSMWFTVGDSATSSYLFRRGVTDLMFLLGNGNLMLGTTTDVASSILTLESTTKGFLPPRMDNTAINAISTPATGLLVYSTTENTFAFYNGTSWRKINDSPL